MFESTDRKALDESVFDSWLEKGRDSRLGYHYLLILWSEMEEEYKPVFAASRSEVETHDTNTNSYEILVAVYDLYSESRVSVEEW